MCWSNRLQPHSHNRTRMVSTWLLLQKRWHSITLQGVVDGKGLFWDVFVGYPGSVHDARVLKWSHLWEIMNNGQFFSQYTVSISGHDGGHYLIGDPAYPLKTWLMKPFSDSGRLTPLQQSYNDRISSARAIVQMPFGKLNSKQRCLLQRNDCQLDLTKKMVLACYVLQNICEEHGDHYSRHSSDEYEHRASCLDVIRTSTAGWSWCTIDCVVLDYFNTDWWWSRIIFTAQLVFFCLFFWHVTVHNVAAFLLLN